jgi:acetoin utilization protein AcuB
MPLNRKVWEYMVKEPPTVAPSDSVGQALGLLIDLGKGLPGIQSLIVTDSGTGALRGVVTLRRIMEGLRKSVGRVTVPKGQSFWELPEITERLRQETQLVKVKDVMSKRIFQVKPYDPVGMAVEIMLENKIRGIPVVENQKVIGVIRITNILPQLQDRLTGNK